MAEETTELQEPVEEIAIGYGWQQAANDVAGNPFIFDDPVLGFTEFDQIQDGEDVGDATYTTVASEGSVPILQSDVINALPTALDPDAQSILAMEMFLNVDAAYGDISQVFEDDGSVNQETFIHAVESTLRLAAQAGPMGYGTTTKYLNILTSAGGSGAGGEGTGPSAEDLNRRFQEEQSKSSGMFPGLVLNRVVDSGFSNVLGRTASKREQQDFAELVLELGDSIKGVEHLGLEAEQFAREVAPGEAAVMDYRGAADSIMEVLGLA
jgi:hypothetical protein